MQIPSEKGSTLKGKDLFTKGANPSSEGRQNRFDRVSSLESVSVPLLSFCAISVEMSTECVYKHDTEQCKTFEFHSTV